MNTFNVKQHNGTDETWELVDAISPPQAAKIYAVALAIKYFIRRNSSWEVDVQVGVPDAPVLTFNVEIELYAEAKLISK